MKLSDARALIATAVPGPGGIWADLGAGEGTFTRALAELLGPSGRIYAVDRDPGALVALRRETATMRNVIPFVADFSSLFELPGLGSTPLDGMLLANSLHFIAGANMVLARLVERLRPGGRAVFVEYDRPDPNRWVPYPIPPARLSDLAFHTGLSTPTIVATRSSTYGGDVYVAWAERLAVQRGN